MTLTRIRRVGVFSVAKMMGLTYAALGLIGGGIFALFSLFGAALGSAFSQGHEGNALFGMIFGFGAVIFFPLLYGIFGFIGGLISGALYNLIAGMSGGVELDLEPVAAIG